MCLLRSRPRFLRLAGLVLTVVALMAIGAVTRASNAEAQCNGTDCLPAGGYTWDDIWGCGLIYSGQDCFQPGNCLAISCGHLHTHGWGSADYDGGGSVFVRIFIGGGNAPRGALGVGFNLARTCYLNRCNDQDAYSMYGHVGWQANGSSTARHTIAGHSKA